LGWGQITSLLDKVKDDDEREWYATAALEAGWTRDTLINQIDKDLYRRQVTAEKATNYLDRLASPQADDAEALLKDPYLFDVVLPEGAAELDQERALVRDVAALLLELGNGFAFVGRQYRLDVAGRDFFIDLLFYNYKLRCFVVVELKNREFDPRDVGQLNFYISTVDEQVRSADDNPTIGMLLCRTKDNVMVEWTLRRVESPIGVAAYETVTEVPAELTDLLPSPQDIAARVWAAGDK
jgi:predicted nuclease of restriction endonuclease-like (RecB) superfamily